MPPKVSPDELDYVQIDDALIALAVRALKTAEVEGALACSKADLAVAVTGVVGPDSDEKGNPVGLVYVAAGRRGGDTVYVKRNFGDQDRARIRTRAAEEAL